MDFKHYLFNFTSFGDFNLFCNDLSLIEVNSFNTQNSFVGFEVGIVLKTMCNSIYLEFNFLELNFTITKMAV